MPPLKDDIDHLLNNHDVGKRLYGNARGGARDGLYDIGAVDEMIDAVLAIVEPTACADSDVNCGLFIQMFPGVRFDDTSAVRSYVDDSIVPLPHLNVPDLSGEVVHSVTTLAGLRRVLSDDDLTRLATHQVTIKTDGTVDDETAFRTALALLKPDDCTFELDPATGLGRFALWFTTAQCLVETRRRCTTPLEVAEALRSRNGLGHRKAGDWLVLLTIPGQVVQRAGHYRPVFCDGGIGDDNWFMSRSSDLTRFAGDPWGQTCDLRALEDGDATYDGVVERIAIQPRHEHLQGERIRFEILDRVGTVYGDAALTRLSDGIWSRKDM